VNGQGKPFPNTTVQHGRPPGCAKKGKSNQRRSSPRNPVVVRAKKSKFVGPLVLRVFFSITFFPQTARRQTA
jgi:hypothetical protein